MPFMLSFLATFRRGMSYSLLPFALKAVPSRRSNEQELAFFRKPLFSYHIMVLLLFMRNPTNISYIISFLKPILKQKHQERGAFLFPTLFTRSSVSLVWVCFSNA
ncbi:hypothetical protein MANES_01G049435v8 [Manihot esculenta]|uniref:Uncharacterized protein n=1 Tax=Manihot esculenta TaxID=3983 RepID=A0ACB7IBQ7_MANES|nr:hypothetical protein MANES_01G049435v8 [Manihot esculenta]